MSAVLWSVVLLPAAVWVAILLAQCACALLPARAAPMAMRRPRVAILIPAHNEAVGIARTLHSVRQQLQIGDRLLVVADNCSDATALVSAEAGAEVAVRENSVLRGKGYALDHGVSYLTGFGQLPEVLIIVDADCVLEPGCIESLARACLESGRPVQGLYLMHSSGSSTAGRLREFAWVVRNRVRPVGWHRLGQPCQLMGTGMAFPWTALASVQLANGHLVEDLQMGVELARMGKAPLFCPQAALGSEFPASGAGINQQRRRWEHGHLGMIVGRVPGLLLEAVRRRNWPLLGLALDMSVPPLALLVLLLSALLVAALLLSALVAMLVASSLLGLLFVAIILAWHGHGRHIMGLSTLLRIPAYVLGKLPLYASFLYQRQTEWVRSKRD